MSCAGWPGTGTRWSPSTSIAPRRRARSAGVRGPRTWSWPSTNSPRCWSPACPWGTRWRPRAGVRIIRDSPPPLTRWDATSCGARATSRCCGRARCRFPTMFTNWSRRANSAAAWRRRCVARCSRWSTISRSPRISRARSPTRRCWSPRASRRCCSYSPSLCRSSPTCSIPPPTCRCWRRWSSTRGSGSTPISGWWWRSPPLPWLPARC